MDDAEADYVIDAVHFLAREGHHFLALYDFDLATGTWVHKHSTGQLPEFSLDAALDNDEGEPATLSLPLRKQLYRHYMNEAQKFAERLRREPQGRMASLGDDLADLQFFALPDDERQPH